MSEQKEHNNCCHYCRISRNRKRKKFVPYLPCKFCPNVFCYNCVVNHLHLNFEETLNDPTFKCLPCHEKCCCCKTECTINHRHCFTYIRTKKRYEKARQWKEKNRGEGDDGPSNSDEDEDGDLSSGPPGNMAAAMGMTNNGFSAFSPQSGNKFNANGAGYANPMLPGPNPDFYSPTRPLGMPLPNTSPNMQPNGPMFYRGPNEPSLNQPMNMRSPNSFNYGPPNGGMPMNGSPFVPAIPNSVPMPSVNGSPNTQPKNPNNPNHQLTSPPQLYNPAQGGGFMPFRRPVSQTGFDEDPSPKRLKTSHNGSPSSNAWPPLVSNMGEPQSNGNGQGGLMMPPMSHNPNMPYFPFPGATFSPMTGLPTGAQLSNSGSNTLKSDGGSPANENAGNGSPQLPKPTRPNDAQNTPPTQREELGSYKYQPFNPHSFPPFMGRPWDDHPTKEQNNGALSLSGLLHHSTGSTSSAGEGSAPGNKDNKSEMNGHHNGMMNGHSFSAQSHLAHHNDLNEAQNGKSTAHEGLHGELTAL